MAVVKKRTLPQQIVFWGGILIAAGLAWWVVRHYELTEIWIREAGWWGPLVAVGLYALLSLTPIPSDPLTILSGALYGWGWAILISWLGNNAAALVEYLIFRDVRTITHFDEQQARLPLWLKRWPVDSPWFLIGVRFVPGFGGKVASIMAGMYRVKWWRFLWTAALANFLGALIWALGGWSLVNAL